MTADVQPKTVPYHFLGPPGIFNPTLLLFVSGLTLLIGSTYAHYRLPLPDWCSFVANTLALHFAGTVIHDACHGVAHRNRITNAVLGHGSALMLGFAFPVFTRVHLQHHAAVNDPENDPDHYVSTGGPLWLIAPRFFSHEVFFFRRQLWRKFELLEWFLSRVYLVTLIVCACKFGFIHYVLNFWFVPALIVGTTLGFFFDYFPHRPFHERNRWRNARVYANPVLNVLILGQNYHLIHHLWPSIPWYKCEPAYHAVKPLLEAKNCHQKIGIFQRKGFLGFVYDFFLGVRFEHALSTDSFTEMMSNLTVDAPEKELQLAETT